MAISRKPRPAAPSMPDVEVDTLIHRGGGVAGEGGGRGRPRLAPVVLRIPGGMLDRVDAVVRSRRVPTRRTTWILEAIAEKLEREGDR